MKKITKSINKYFISSLIVLFIGLSCLLSPFRVSAQVDQNEINGDLMKASSEFLRDLDYETWQLVVYKSPVYENKLILRIVGYPGSLRIDHPLGLEVESGRKKWIIKDITILNEELSQDRRQAAAEFDLEELINDISKNRPLRLSLNGVFSELPVPPFLVKEWRDLK